MMRISCKPAKKHLCISNRASAETTWPRRALCVGLTISPKLESSLCFWDFDVFRRVIARQQQAKSWELRAAMSLARLWRDQGKPQRGLRCTGGSRRGLTRAI
jgi:hypothetical protein